MKKCLTCHNEWQRKNHALDEKDDGYNICKHCGKRDLPSEFETAFMCTACFRGKKSAQDKEYRETHKEEKAAKDKEYRENNKEKLSEQAAVKYVVNKKVILERVKSYRKNKIATDPSFVEQERIRSSESAKRPESKARRNEQRQDRRKQDPSYRLRAIVSKSVWDALQKNGGSKNGDSSIKRLPYTMDELRAHLESLFEPWMNWDNQGHYKVGEWNDHDPATWKWQIDHIIPHSKFKYASMEDQAFKDCWALSNLRPYSAKQNVVDGDRK